MLRIMLMTCLILFLTADSNAEKCTGKAIELQVLGSGGPETQDKRASSSYIIWRDGKARVLIDSGGGSALRFGESEAQMKDLHLVLFTHLHADHSADFPALVKSSFFEDRTRPLPVLGPTGNALFPSMTEFIRGLFEKKRGIYRYLSEYLTGGADSYALQPKDLEIGAGDATEVFSSGGLKVFGLSVEHGPVPSVAYRIEFDGTVMVFTGDTNGNNKNMAVLAKDADLFVAHNAVSESAEGVERRLHMPPSVIGRIASEGQVKKLVLSHRMIRTLGREDETLESVQRHYKGPSIFANDLDCFPLQQKSER
ncbi:MAG: MBL fold metallo-hydrolase [Nitrospirae bacterium]|nr:MBL fold metallo-hydrolase [Nitrospirota bacterium]